MSTEQELLELRKKLEEERDRKIEDAVQTAIKAQLKAGELQAALTSANTHIHDVERKADAALRKGDHLQDEEIPLLKEQIRALKPAGSFFNRLNEQWDKLLVYCIIASAIYILAADKLQL